MSDPSIVVMFMVFWPILALAVIIGFGILVIKAIQAVNLLREIDTSLKTLPSVQQGYRPPRSAYR